MTDPTSPRRHAAAPAHGAGAEPGPNWKRRGLLAVAAVLALFMALNLQEVEVNFIFGSAQLPLIFALLVAAGLGALVGWATPRIRRGKDHRGE